MKTRVNARLPEPLARKVALVQRKTRKGVSAIVAESLERYCDQVLRAEEGAQAALAGFIGCAEGPRDLSTTYKKELAASLGRKA